MNDQTELKKCTKCNEVKSIDNYNKYKLKPKKDGTQKIAFRSYCKKCQYQMGKDWHDKNEGYKNKWRRDNKDKVKAQNERARKRVKKWRKKNIEILNEKSKNRKREDKQKNGMKKYRESSKRCRENLTDGYVICKIVRDTGLKSSQIKMYPELIETKRLLIKTKRLCRTSQNSEKA